MPLGEFTSSRAFTLGVELELQIVNRHDYDLAPGAADLLDDDKANLAGLGLLVQAHQIEPVICPSEPRCAHGQPGAQAQRANTIDE